MADGYTRQSASQIVNGNVIDADDFDAEFNAISGAMNASSGHNHDGTTGGGARISTLGPSGDLTVSGAALVPKVTDTLDLGTSTILFKDGFFEGTLNTDILSVDETSTFTGAITASDTLSVTGAITASSTLDVTGATGIDGDFDINTDKFTVTAASGNTSIAGTLDVTGATGIDGDFDISTDKFTVAAASGNTSIAGTLDVTGATGIDGNFDVATDKFTVASATGNTSIAGTLAVTGEITATGGVSGDLTGNADTATTWATAREIALTGDVTGTVTGVNGGGNISIATTISADSVALGTDTTGNYVNDITAGTGVTVTHTPAEGSSPTIAIGQAVGTTDNVTFNDVTVSGDLTVSGTTTTVNTETINLADNQIVLNSNYTGSTPTENGGIEIERGTLTNKTLVWDETDDKWTVGSETFVASTFEGALSGNATTATTASSAQALTGDVSVTGNWTAAATGDIYIKPTGDNVYMQGTTSSEQLDFSLGTSEQTITSSDSLKLTSGNYTTVAATNDVVLEPTGGKIILQSTAQEGYFDIQTTGTVKLYTGTLSGTLNTTFSNDDVIVEGDLTATTVNATTVDLGDWTITESAGVLYFATGGTNKMKLDASGNLTVTGNVTAYGTV